ncbi:TPA: HaeII family restriction endonuclease [Clostridioides difficile]|nr:HaeII family restriction endonuclease [Clostridioides difficile]
MDWNSFDFIDLFAGIGGMRLGFESVGGKCVFSSEWDEDACKTYEANFRDMPFGDITKINPSDIPDFDILLAGFPCQPFSIIGDKEGFAHETQGTLFFNIEEILRVKKPKGFMLENVRNLTSHDKGRTFSTILRHLEALGYNVHSKVLNALDFGLPQKRERIIIVGFLENVRFEFPGPIQESEKISLKDILEPEEQIEKKLYVKEEIKLRRNEKMKKEIDKPYITHENVSGSITPHHYSCALRAGASSNYLLINNERRPSSRELLRLQGFPDDYKIVVPYSAIKKQTGNSVAVPVIKAVAKQMLKGLKEFKGDNNMDREKAKLALDSLIKKSRVHLYKPIQVAEILYRDRVYNDINLLDLETYRSKSKKWRDGICIDLLGRKCTSSSRFQDDLFNENAIPPQIMHILGNENRKTNGSVESYIYSRFADKHSQLSDALLYCKKSTKDNFNIKKFIDSFRMEVGLKRSLDKIYEIVVYALFSTLIEVLELTVEVSINENKLNIVQEFEDFTESIMCLDFSNPIYVQSAKVYRVGVTNAADRGLDMYSNWGPAIQIKHLALDEELAEGIVNSVSSDKIVIVCKTAEKGLIVSLLNQIGWKSKIQSIVTEDNLINWYEKALLGKYSEEIGNKLLKCLIKEIENEFPSVIEEENILTSRNYKEIKNEFWR